MDDKKHASDFLVAFICLLIGGMVVIQHVDETYPSNLDTKIITAADEARQMLKTQKLQSAMKRRPAYKNVIWFRTALAKMGACREYDGLVTRIERVQSRYMEKYLDAYKSWVPNNSGTEALSVAEVAAIASEGYPPEIIPQVIELMEEFPLPNAHTDPIKFRLMERFECEELLKHIDGGGFKVKARTNEPLY